MSEDTNLGYESFSAGYTAGEAMMIATFDTSIDEIMDWVFNSRSLWFYDGVKYRIVIRFEEIENGAILYFFDDNGTIISQQFGGDS